MILCHANVGQSMKIRCVNPAHLYFPWDSSKKRINGHGRNLLKNVQLEHAGPHIPSHPFASHFSPHHTRGHIVESHHPSAPFFWPPGLLLFCVWYLIKKKNSTKTIKQKHFESSWELIIIYRLGVFQKPSTLWFLQKNGRWQVCQIRSARSTWNRRKSASHVANWLEDARRNSNQICLLLLSLIVSCNLIAGWSGIAQRAFNDSTGVDRKKQKLKSSTHTPSSLNTTAIVQSSLMSFQKHIMTLNFYFPTVSFK